MPGLLKPLDQRRRVQAIFELALPLKKISKQCPCQKIVAEIITTFQALREIRLMNLAVEPAMDDPAAA